VWHSLAPIGGSEELIDLGVGSRYLIDGPRSSDPTAFLDVGSWWCSLHQSHLLLLCQVLQLYREQCKLGDRHHAVLFAPVQDVLLPQLVCIPSNVVAPRQLVTLLDVVKCEQPIVTMAHVTHAKVNAGAVACGANHQVHHRSGDVDLFTSCYWSFVGPTIAVFSFIISGLRHSIVC
jgi:hypothetical protein